jgi:hypothetical protein
MRKIAVSAALVGMTLGGVALPTAANAATHHHHAKHHHGSGVKNAPCSGLGIDIALGNLNYCIPL